MLAKVGEQTIQFGVNLCAQFTAARRAQRLLESSRACPAAAFTELGLLLRLLLFLCLLIESLVNGCR